MRAKRVELEDADGRLEHVTGALTTIDALVKAARHESIGWLASHRLRAYGTAVGALPGRAEMKRRRQVKLAMETWAEALAEVHERVTNKGMVEELEVQLHVEVADPAERLTSGLLVILQAEIGRWGGIRYDQDLALSLNKGKLTSGAEAWAVLQLTLPINGSTARLRELLASPDATKSLGAALRDTKAFLGLQRSPLRKISVGNSGMRQAPSLTEMLSRARHAVAHHSELVAGLKRAKPSKPPFGEGSLDFCHGLVRMLHLGGELLTAECTLACPLLASRLDSPAARPALATRASTRGSTRNGTNVMLRRWGTVRSWVLPDKHAGDGRSAVGLQALVAAHTASSEAAALLASKQERTVMKRSLLMEQSRALVIGFLSKQSRGDLKLKQFYAEAEKRCPPPPARPPERPPHFHRAFSLPRP